MKIINSIYDNLTVNFYYWMIAILYILYIGTFLGISFTEDLKKKYAHILSIFIQTFIAIILIAKFNPFFDHKPTSNDKIFIFASACFLLTNVGITEWILQSVDTDIFHPILATRT